MISAAKTWEKISVLKSDQSVQPANEAKVVPLEAVIAAETEAVEAVRVVVAVVAAVADSDAVVAEEEEEAVAAAVVAEADPVAAVAVGTVAKPRSSMFD